jgi:hypothetical protein
MPPATPGYFLRLPVFCLAAFHAVIRLQGLKAIPV